METDFDLEQLKELESLKQYKDYDYDYFQSKAPEIDKKRKELSHLQSEMAIVKEQEGETNTEAEEKNLLYWKNGLDQHRAYLASIQTAEEQLRAMKEKYERKKIYYETRIQTAEQELEKKKSKKSRNQIKFSMKIAEVEKVIKDYDDASKGYMRYNELLGIVGKAYQAAKQKQMKNQMEKSNAAPSKVLPAPQTPEPTNTYTSSSGAAVKVLQTTKAKKKAKQVSVQPSAPIKMLDEE